MGVLNLVGRVVSRGQMQKTAKVTVTRITEHKVTNKVRCFSPRQTVPFLVYFLTPFSLFGLTRLSWCTMRRMRAFPATLLGYKRHDL